MQFHNKLSLIAYIISALLLFYLTFFYYPKWKNTGTEATISWDVSGYYMYLPAIFIYHDLKHCKFKDKIIQKYRPSPNFQETMKIESGNFVMKYSSGQAIQFLPFFLIADYWAKNSDKYKADGFSFPYQFMITVESFLVALLGLWFLRLILLYYFKDKIVSIVMLGIVFGTNYLEYSTMAGAMTHNNLFTIYAILIYIVIKFYSNPKYIYAILIGGLTGLATLTRPTELVSVLIPLLWGIKANKQSLLTRIEFFKSHWRHLVAAAITTILIGSIQLFYWKYISGDWFVYSYDDQGFNLIKPHFWLGIFSYRSGWLVYTPMMIFPIIGFYYLYKNHKKLFTATFVFFLVFIYWTFAWNIWWYGGSLGMRAMVQSYPILAFPFAAFVEKVLKTKYFKYMFGIIFIVFSYYNLWLTHQAHRGGLLKPGAMTKAYFWKILGKYKKDINDLKLLDTKEEFIGKRQNIKLLYKNDFENDSSIYTCDLSPIQGKKSLCLDGEHQWHQFEIVLNKYKSGQWIRASADFNAPWKEWTDWQMTQFIIEFYDKNNNKLKSRMIRVHRFLENGKTKNIYFDTKIPDKEIAKILIKFWNSEGQKQIIIDNLKLELYETGK